MSQPRSLPMRIAGGAIGFVRRNPALIGVWSVVIFAEALIAGLLMRPAMERILAQAQGGLPIGSDEAMPLGAVFLSYLLTFGILIVMLNGAMRAVLQPGRRRWAYLRLGMDELRVLGAVLAIGILGYVATLIVTVALSIPLAMLAALLGGGEGAIAAMLFLTMGAVAIGAFYIGARMSPAYPLTLLRRRIILRPAWRLTRGRGWALAGGYALIGLICVGLMLVVTMPFIVFGGLPSMSGASDPQESMAAFTAIMALTTSFSLMSIVLRTLGALAGALTIALPGAALATALVALEEERDLAQ